MLRVAGLLATFAGWLSRRLGRGGGTTLPGVVLLKLRPHAIAEMAAGLRDGTVLCSATNGKTTTTHLIVAGAEANGRRVVTNTEGSNLERGIAAALLSGRSRADVGIFEVDEAALTPVAHASAPQVLVLMNLFRDQLDRYGELETLVDKWNDLLDELDRQSTPPALVLNADDPNIAEIGRNRADVTWFGVDDLRHAQAVRSHAADAINCRRCGGPLRHDVVLLGHLGHWHCTSCDASRPTPHVAATRVEMSGDGGQTTTVEIRRPAAAVLDIASALPGLHNAYNLTAAVAATAALANRAGVALDSVAVAKTLGHTAPAFGRGETIAIGDKSIRLLLAKNPTGVNQNVRTLLDEPGAAHVLVLLNDGTADGQDISWIWDVDWEGLQPRLASLALGGDRADDLALRFRYGGFDLSDVVIETAIPSALDAALEQTPPGMTLHVLPTYTAMLALRSELVDRGLADPYWADA